MRLTFWSYLEHRALTRRVYPLEWFPRVQRPGKFEILLRCNACSFRTFVGNRI